MSRFAKTTRELYDPLELGHDPSCTLPHEHRVTSAQGRAVTLLSRLVLNVCAAIQAGRDGSTAVLRPRTRRRNGDKRRRVKSLHGTSDRELVLPVTVDMRAHVADYLSGDLARVYKVRWVVRGHYRHQPYGPGRAKRRRIWIAPHWKGPEGAPPKGGAAVGRTGASTSATDRSK